MSQTINDEHQQKKPSVFELGAFFSPISFKKCRKSSKKVECHLNFSVFVLYRVAHETIYLRT